MDDHASNDRVLGNLRSRFIQYRTVPNDRISGRRLNEIITFLREHSKGTIVSFVNAVFLTVYILCINYQIINY